MGEPNRFIDMLPAFTLALAALNIVNILYTWWRTRNQNVEDRFKAGSERMDRLDGRLASVEQTLRAQPTKEDLHDVKLTIEGLRGDMRELRAAQIASTKHGERQDLVLSRLEQFLLERK